MSTAANWLATTSSDGASGNGATTILMQDEEPVEVHPQPTGHWQRANGDDLILDPARFAPDWSTALLSNVDTSVDQTRTAPSLRPLIPPSLGYPVRFTGIALSPHHATALDASGCVYSWGNNAFGRTGLGLHEGAQHAPTPVLGLWNLHIVRLAVGDAHSLFLAKTGVLYTCGAAADGRTGVVNQSSNILTPIQLLHDQWYCGEHDSAKQRIAHVWSAVDSSAAVTECGALYVWGGNSHGKLGLGRAGPVSTPTHHPHFPGSPRHACIAPHWLSDPGDQWPLSKPVSGGGTLMWTRSSGMHADAGASYAAAGRPCIGGGMAERFCVWLSAAGGVWVSGRSPGGERGANSLSMIKVLFPGGAGPAADVDCSDSHILACTDSGAVFAWGITADGACGSLSNTRVLRQPALVTGLNLDDDEPVQIVHVRADMGVSFGIDSNATLWRWGRLVDRPFLDGRPCKFQITPPQQAEHQRTLRAQGRRYSVRGLACWDGHEVHVCNGEDQESTGGETCIMSYNAWWSCEPSALAESAGNSADDPTSMQTAAVPCTGGQAAVVSPLTSRSAAEATVVGETTAGVPCLDEERAVVNSTSSGPSDVKLADDEVTDTGNSCSDLPGELATQSVPLEQAQGNTISTAPVAPLAARPVTQELGRSPPELQPTAESYRRSTWGASELQSSRRARQALVHQFAPSAESRDSSASTEVLTKEAPFSQPKLHHLAQLMYRAPAAQRMTARPRAPSNSTSDGGARPRPPLVFQRPSSSGSASEDEVVIAECARPAKQKAQRWWERLCCGCCYSR